MLSQDSHMTAALRKSVIGTTYLFDYCVSSEFDRCGHTKSDSESDRKYGSFQCGRFVQRSCTESHLCNFRHMEKLKCMFMHFIKPLHSF